MREPEGDLDDFRPGRPVATTHPFTRVAGHLAPRCGLPRVGWKDTQCLTR